MTERELFEQIGSLAYEIGSPETGLVFWRPGSEIRICHWSMLAFLGAEVNQTGIWRVAFDQDEEDFEDPLRHNMEEWYGYAEVMWVGDRKRWKRIR